MVICVAIRHALNVSCIFSCKNIADAVAYITDTTYLRMSQMVHVQ